MNPVFVNASHGVPGQAVQNPAIMEHRPGAGKLSITIIPDDMAVFRDAENMNRGHAVKKPAPSTARLETLDPGQNVTLVLKSSSGFVLFYAHLSLEVTVVLKSLLSPGRVFHPNFAT